MILIAPEGAHALGDFLLLGVLLVGGIEACAAEALGKELLLYEVARIVVGILIICAIAELIHKLRGGIPKV